MQLDYWTSRVNCDAIKLTTQYIRGRVRVCYIVMYCVRLDQDG